MRIMVENIDFQLVSWFKCKMNFIEDLAPERRKKACKIYSIYSK